MYSMVVAPTNISKFPMMKASKTVNDTLVKVTMTDGLTKEEIALYDRQIRLWGMDTQLRLRSFKLLLINVGGIGTEIVKNLVLGGLHSIELLDDSKVKEEDYSSQFFLPKEEKAIGEVKLPLIVESIKELNLRVELTINIKSLDQLLADSPEYFSEFNLVIGTELTKQQMIKLNDICRGNQVPVYFTGLHGLFGYIFTDLIQHEATCEWDTGNQQRKPGTQLNHVKQIIKIELGGNGKELVTIKDNFNKISDIFHSKQLPHQLNNRQLKRLSGALPIIFALLEIERPENPETILAHNDLKGKALDICKALNIPSSIITDEYVELFTRNAFTEFSPVAAIIGGCLAQDVIQMISKKESPINNVLILDSIKSEMPIYAL